MTSPLLRASSLKCPSRLRTMRVSVEFSSSIPSTRTTSTSTAVPAASGSAGATPGRLRPPTVSTIVASRTAPSAAISGAKR